MGLLIVCFIVSCLCIFYVQTDVMEKYFICIQDDNDILNTNNVGVS